MKPKIFVIDDQECFLESCQLTFEDDYIIKTTSSLDEFEESFTEEINESQAIIVDFRFGRQTVLSWGFCDRIRRKFKYTGKMILFSVTSDFESIGCDSVEIAKFDAIWDKETDITLENLQHVLNS